MSTQTSGRALATCSGPSRAGVCRAYPARVPTVWWTIPFAVNSTAKACRRQLESGVIDSSQLTSCGDDPWMRALPAGIGQSVEYLIQSGSSSGEGSAACEWWVPAICLMGPLSHEKSHMAKLTARAGHGRSMTVSVEKGAVGGGSEG